MQKTPRDIKNTEQKTLAFSPKNKRLPGEAERGKHVVFALGHLRGTFRLPHAQHKGSCAPEAKPRSPARRGVRQRRPRMPRGLTRAECPSVDACSPAGVLLRRSGTQCPGRVSGRLEDPLDVFPARGPEGRPLVGARATSLPEVPAVPGESLRCQRRFAESSGPRASPAERKSASRAETCKHHVR